jgi:hypothetical protein
MLVPLRRTQWYPVWPVMDRSTNLSVILIYKKKKKKNCQQSYKYQQEEQPPLLSLTVKQKIPQQHMTLEINVMSWNKQKNTTGLYRFNGFQ